MASIDDLIAIGQVPDSFDASSLLESIGIVEDYCDAEAERFDAAIKVTDIKSGLDPKRLLSLTGIDFELDLSSAIGDLSAINLSKLYDDIIVPNAERLTTSLIDKTVSRAKEAISKAEDQLAKALDTNFSLIKSVEDAWDVVQNTISVALTANGPILLLVIMQNLAKDIIKDLEERDESIQEIIDYSNILFNQLKLIINGRDNVSPYIDALRQALSLLIEAESSLRSTRNSLNSTDVFHKRNYDSMVSKLEEALELMRPQSRQVDGGFFQDQKDTILPPPLKDDDGINKFAQSADNVIAGAGASLDELLDFKEEEERLQTLLAIHLTMQKLGAAAAEFSSKTTTVNFKITSYLEGVNQIDKMNSGKAFNRSLVSHMDGTLDDLSVIILEMDDEVPRAFGEKTPKRFQKSRLALKGPAWGLDLIQVIAHARTLPSITGQDVSDAALLNGLYFQTVELLNDLDGRAEGIATLTGINAKENPAELVSACVRVIGSSFRAISNFQVSDVLEQQFKNIRDRAELSRDLGEDIIRILKPFATAQNPALVAGERLVKSVKDLLRDTGFDKAADRIDLGKFNEVLTEGAQIATYIGSAILAVNSLISDIDDCPATSEEDKQSLEAVRDEFRNDEVRKELNSRRSAERSRRSRITQLVEQKNKILDQCERVTSIGAKCVPEAQTVTTVQDQVYTVTGDILNIGVVG